MRPWCARVLMCFGAVGVMPTVATGQDTRCDRGELEVVAVDFIGNTAFTDSELASGIVTTASSGLRRVFRIGGARRCLKVDELPLDVVRLRLWYRNHGFLDASVDTTVVPEGRARVAVRFRITEGEPMRVDTLRILGLDAVPDGPSLSGDLPTRVGGWFDRYANAATRDTLTRRLRNNGYPDAETFLSYDTRVASRRATVVFTVVPGARRRIGRIDLDREGLDGRAAEVRESAIRRLSGLEIGDLYRERTLERAKRTLYQSEAFAQVLVEPGAVIDDSTMAVAVTVRESFLRAARLGGGWGSLDCFRTTGDLTEYNLFDSATRLELRARVSKIGIGDPLDGAASLCPQAREDVYSANLNYYVGATISQPAVLRSSFLPTLSLYSERRSEFNAFLRTTPAGGSVAMTRAQGRRAEVIGYTVEYGRTEAQPALFCAVFNACEADDRASLQRDLRLAVLSGSMSYERTDDPVDPRRGVVARAEGRHASQVVGAERGLAFNRVTLDGSAYVPFGPDIVLAMRMRLGAVFGGRLSLNEAATFVPPQERLFAGGPTSVRGFRQNELGPSVYIPTAFDTVNAAGRPVTAVNPGDTVFFRSNPELVSQRAVPTGGNTLLIGNAELRVTSPVLPNVLKWTMFADVGELWNRSGSAPGLGFRSLKVTPGFGIRLRTPIGYLRADLAYNGYDRAGGAAYFDAPVATGGQLWCVSPGNTIPVTVGASGLVQGSGACPASFAPREGRGLFGRWTPSFAIGQAF